MFFEKWFPVDLLKLPSHVQDVGMPLFVGDNDAIRIGATVQRGGVDEDVTGTVKGYVILPNGADIAPFDGYKEGNKAWIDLPGDALCLSGRIQIALRVFDGEAVTTLAATTATVRRADGDTHYDPEDVVGDLTTLISRAEAAAHDASEALAAADHLVRYDVPETPLTEAEKAQARANIRAQERIEPDGAVTLDLSNLAAVYITGNVGQKISYKSSTASMSYKRIAWVQAGCNYVLSATSGALGSANARVCAITDTSDIMLQRFEFALVANGTGEVTFTAEADGLLCVCVDTSTTTVALHGGPVYGAVREVAGSIAAQDREIAANQHSVGDLLTVGGTLYKVTQPIVAGDTIQPGTNVTETTVAAQLAERDTEIAAETAAREAAIAELPAGAGAFFVGQLAGSGSVEMNAKRVTIAGNRVHMEGLGSGANPSTFVSINVLGTPGGVSGTYTDARVKSLFTSGYCYTADGAIFPENRAGILRLAYMKRSAATPPNAWEFGVGLYTYDAATDTLTAGYHGYGLSSYINDAANGPMIHEVSLSADFMEAVRANKTLAFVIYGKAGAQYVSSSLDLCWEINLVTPTT